jgi:carbamoyltransferase
MPASPKSSRAAKGVRRVAFPPARPRPDRLAALRERLGALRFTESAVADRLEVPHPAAISRERYPLYEARLARREDPLATAIGLFLLQAGRPREAVEEAFGPEVAEDLVAWGILGPAPGGALAAAVSVYPCAGAWLVTDHRFPPGGRGATRGDAVMYLGGDSYALAYLAPEPAEGARVLDLCTGSGVHAILAAPRAARVVGVDVNPRAVAFARFNAALNGVAARCEVRRGDLFRALAHGDERFDLILANPPFVPSPHRGRARIGFRDAGPAGEDVLARLIEGLPARLARDGVAAIVSVFVDERGRSFREKLDRWLGPRAGLAALLLRMGAEPPEDYAFAQARDPVRFARWLAALRRARIERIQGGILALRRHAGPTPPPYRALDIGAPRAPDRRALSRALDAFEAARAAVFPDEVLDRRARRAEDLVLADEVEARDGALATVRHRARLRSGFAGEVLLSPELRAVLDLADGTRTLRAIVAAAAAADESEPEPERGKEEGLAARLFPDLIELAERGFLRLDAP